MNENEHISGKYRSASFWRKRNDKQQHHCEERSDEVIQSHASLAGINVLFFIIILFWICLNVLQAIFTEILTDEAYYFLYGENLSWGYFDHPPMVGLMIYLSNIFFDGNLSVRFLTILLQPATLWFCWKLIDEKSPDTSKIMLFFIISCSMIMFQVYGFITTPDVPLLFFITFFLWSYKRFLEKESWMTVLWLAIAISGMIYSKYHAFILIGLVVLSNLKLLLNYKVWIAGLLAVLILSPHIYWQISNDFPSFQYHANDRNNGFEWECFLGYIPNQMAVFNPFLLGVAVYIMIKHKVRDAFERGLYFIIIGFIGFFWVLSTIRWVEPHWTLAATIPIIALIYRHSTKDVRIFRFVKKWGYLSIALILFCRLALASGMLPENLAFNGKEPRSKALETIAGDLPVVFTGSFQDASNYHFFTKKESLLLSAVNTRFTQFDFLQKELRYQGKPVFVCVPVEGRYEPFHIGDYCFYGFVTEHFQSVNRVKIDFTLKDNVFYPGDNIRLLFTLHNPDGYTIDFQHSEFPVVCKAGFGITSGYKRYDFIDGKLNEPVNILPAYGELQRTMTTVAPDIPPGRYQFFLTLENPLCASRNSHFVTVEIKKKK